jgi:hypothetical protein
MIDRHDAPKDWPTVPTSAQECPDLTGQYVSSDQGSPAVPLARWILPKTTYPLERIERVTFTGPTNGTLTVRLIEGPNADVFVRELKQGIAYRCESGWLVLSVEGVLLPPFMYSADARLARTADGRLIVEATRLYTGIAPGPPVPFVETGNKWHLYSKVAE